jgi:hypothetical protein
MNKEGQMATGTKLVIVESPTKAKKIGGYLGKGYTVMASVGHIRDLAQPSQIPAAQKSKFGRFGVDVDDGFAPYYVVGAEKKKTVAELRAALKRADELILATDEDRWTRLVRSTITWSMRRRPAACSTVSSGMNCPRSCGAKWVRACRPAACSPWRPAWSSSASANAWRSCASRTGI